MTEHLKAQKDLWHYFSIYIRLRDCKETTGTLTHGRCFTCSKVVPYQEADAGHYISRVYKSTCYDERNVHLQCVNCNRLLRGNPEIYKKRIIAIYGQEVLDDLEHRKFQLALFKGTILDDMKTYYQEKIKTL